MQRQAWFQLSLVPLVPLRDPAAALMHRYCTCVLAPAIPAANQSPWNTMEARVIVWIVSSVQLSRRPCGCLCSSSVPTRFNIPPLPPQANHLPPILDTPSGRHLTFPYGDALRIIANYTNRTSKSRQPHSILLYIHAVLSTYIG
ncbi:hypothetical protein B0I35DRAFT_190499 [Stachybotrys elegans]|uniref:Uncharacterized protein n=1 Tax=Stachybotrys elegans TaxID=80388 RepID=A0A8K0SXJ9_9HYPO|nr:hypothetical protein B0I35DRAFT_190499 [Stachybotrys elegans]